MSRNALATPRGARMLQSVLRAACPPRDRLWVDAIFGELDAIDSDWARFFWLIGTLRFIVRRNQERLTSLLFRGRSAVFLALISAVLFGGAARAQFEGLGVDDDVFIIAAAFCATTPVVYLCRTALRVIRSHPTPAPRIP